MYPEELNHVSAVGRGSADDLALALCHAAGEELGDALQMIEHCLGQLGKEQIWRRDPSGINPIGNLVLHLAGNLRQWIVSGLGGAPDVRDRPQEFSESALRSKEQLLSLLRGSVAEAKQALAHLDASDLLRSRRIQGFEMTGIAALGHAIPHFRGHTQEIIRATREQLGSAYRMLWAPQTPEQGSPG